MFLCWEIAELYCGMKHRNRIRIRLTRKYRSGFDLKKNGFEYVLKEAPNFSKSICDARFFKRKILFVYFYAKV